MRRVTLYIILFLSLFLAVVMVKASPANYLTNPNFEGGITNWTVAYDTQGDANCVIEYDGVYYQGTPAGSLHGKAVGKNLVLQGYAWQTVATSINIEDTVKLQLWWSKRSIAKDAPLHTIKAQIAKPSTPTTWVDIWSEASAPANDGATAWADTGLVDVDSYFNENGTYKFRWYFDLKAGSAASAEAYAWIDTTSLDVVQPNITVGTSGNQVTNMNINSTNNYIGTFTFVRDSGATNVTQIIISETGTVNANANLSNLDLYYETAALCTYVGDEILFGTAASFDASENATVSGTRAVGTSQVCFYVVLDVGSGATAGETIEIEITDPSTEVTVNAGTVSPSTAVAIPGTTTLQEAGPSLSFSISDNSIGFGSLNTSAPRFATGTDGSDSETSAHDLDVSISNASGYSITVKGATLTFDSYTIDAIGGTATDVTTGAGTEQFGIRLTVSGGGSVVAPYNGAVNMYAYAATASAEDEVASFSGASDTSTFSVYYAANISTSSEAGTYTSALTYVCTGNF